MYIETHAHPAFRLGGAQMLVDFYGVEPGFPLTTHLITRSMETAFPKRLYFVSAPSTAAGHIALSLLCQAVCM